MNDFLANLAVSTLVADIGGSIYYAGTGEGFNNFDSLRGAGIFRSLDNGATWQQMASTNTNDFQYVSRIATHPTTPGHLYAATDSGIWESTNFALTWTRILNVPRIGINSVEERFLDVDVTFNEDSSELWLAAGTSRNLHVSTDGGANWSLMTTGNANELPAPPAIPAPPSRAIPNHRCEVVFASLSGNDPYLYSSVNRNSGEIWRSIDGGATWTRRSTGSNYLGTQGWYDNVIWAEPGNPSRVIVGGIDLYRSTDGGTTLTQFSDWQDYRFGSSAHGDQHLIVPHPLYDGSSNSQVYFGNDGGVQLRLDPWTGNQNAGWTNLANDLGITQFYRGSASGGVVMGGAQDNSVLVRSSSTTNWVKSFTGDGASVAVHPANADTLYGCTQWGTIRRSFDRGSFWQLKTTGLPVRDRNNFGFITPFELDENSPTDMVLGGMSIHRSTNSANNWSSIRGPIAGSPASSVVTIANTNSSRI